jgi:hypothetical protein
MATQATTLGAEFARHLAAKDFASVAALLAPDIDFRGLTPRRFWEAAAPEEVVGGILRQWFEDSDEIIALEKLETDELADRERVAYRFRIRNPEGLFVVEQQAYLSERDGSIGWMRVLCSGFRPLEEQ